MAGATKANLDFTNVREAGQFNKKHFPEGGHKGKITKVQDAKSGKSGESMWVYTIEVKYNSSVGTYGYYCVLNEKNLWKLRALFAACGIVIPKKKIGLDPNKIVGRVIGVDLQDTEYDGKQQSEVGAVLPVSEIVDDGVPDTDDEDELDEEETEEEEEEEEEPTPPPAKKRATKKPAPEPEPEDEDEEEEEEDEEPEPTPPPKRSAKKAAAPAKKAATRKPRPATEDDLEELDLDELE